ncbi:unnamed protein product [Nippostrongylus brasiliensis]|uniref:Putative zinc finger protein (inferred by orthology to a C. elegans protein) n=1 Tax=Nippostrongylus brasiliensis TaxID=27835 RepID=A0A158R3N5_NIPBR|nr:unnamed protein product [Nippostrongylus brasiliensis]
MDIASSSTHFESISGSPYGFPESEVIFFINSCGIQKEDARDFMLFLTFANQLHQQTTIKDTDTVANAVALVDLVNQLHNPKLPKIDGKENPSRIDVPTEKPTLVSILQHGKPTTSSQYKCEETVTVAHRGPPKSDENSPSGTFAACPKHTPLPQYKYSRSPQGKHNDMKFYPNIICVICREWVCSRSRRLHVGAHFNYRKYNCAQCGFSHSKEIFVRSHARKVHNSNDCVKQKDDPVLENKLLEFYKVAENYGLKSIFAGRMSVAELVGFEENLLKAAFAYIRPRKEYPNGIGEERSLLERIFGVYVTFVIFYAQPLDYVTKIHITPVDRCDLMFFLWNVLIPGYHVDACSCIQRLFVDAAFRTVVSVKNHDLTNHKRYEKPNIVDVLVDEKERYNPIEVTKEVMENPAMKAFFYVESKLGTYDRHLNDTRFGRNGTAGENIRRRVYTLHKI